MENKSLDKIIERSHDLFTRYGIKTISMDDIAKNCAISKKTLYLLIKDKQDLVKRGVYFEIQRQNNEFKTILTPEMNAIEELISINNFMGEHLKQKRFAFNFDLKKYYPQIFEEISKIKHEKMYESISRNMNKGIKEGIYRSEINVDIIANLHVNRMENQSFMEKFSEKDVITGKIFKEILIYHIRGIANRKGLDILDGKISQNDI